MTSAWLLWFGEMNDFDKRMALDVIEDVLSALSTAEDRALVFGLCSAFYMCGLLSHAEWEAIVAQIAGGLGWGPELKAGVPH